LIPLYGIDNDRRVENDNDAIGRSIGRTTDEVVSYGRRWYAYTDWTRRGRRTPRELETRARPDPSSPRAPAHHHRRRRSQLAKTAAAVATGIAGLAARVRRRINARGIRTPRTFGTNTLRRRQSRWRSLERRRHRCHRCRRRRIFATAVVPSEVSTIIINSIIEYIIITAVFKTSL